MSVLVNLRITGYHLVILTNWLLLLFSNKNRTKITKKLFILFLFLKINFFINATNNIFRKRKGKQGKVTSDATSKL
jgi:hypothetical protein